MSSPASSPRDLRRDRRGATALEFAVVGGILITLLLGIIELARYQVTVQSLRVATGDAARAALVSVNRALVDTTVDEFTAECPASVTLDTAQRADLVARTPFLDAGRLTVNGTLLSSGPTITVDCTAKRIAVTLSYPFSFIVRFLPQSTVTVTDGTTMSF